MQYTYRLKNKNWDVLDKKAKKYRGLVENITTQMMQFGEEIAVTIPILPTFREVPHN